MSTFNELIDFTRSTTGTYLDSVVYGDELVVNGTFDSGTTGWFTSPSGGVTGSVVNGEYNLNNTAGGGKGVTQVFKTQAGKTYKITATARKISGISAFLVAAQTNWGFSDNLAYASTTSSSNVELSVTFKAVDEESYVYLRSDAVGVTVFDNVSVKEIIGGQVSGTPLLRTAAINEPRLEYDASGNPLGLLIEEARTNKATYSQDFTHSSWNKSDVTVAAAPIAAPDGTMTANHVVKTGSNGHLSKNAVGNTSDRASVWARTVSGTGTMYLGYQNVSHEVTVTEEWQRFDAQLNNANAYVANFRGAATLTEVYLWGAQVETGAFPTSYIPTSGSTVTRAVDSAVATLSDFYYRQKHGSMVVEFTSKYDESAALYKRVCEIGNTGTSVNRIITYVKTDETRLSSQVYDNNAPQYRYNPHFIFAQRHWSLLKGCYGMGN